MANKMKFDLQCNERFLDQLEDKRLNAQRMQSTLCSNRAPSRYPGLYEAEDIDDGRLDHEAAARHFVTADDVVDDREPYVVTAEDDEMDPGEERAILATIFSETERQKPRGPRSTKNYCAEYRARLHSIKIILVSNGSRHVPYTSPKVQAAIEKR